MADDLARVLADINRTLKDIANNQREQIRILKTLNHNCLEVHQRPEETPEIAPPDPLYEPRTYGWSMANSVQTEGGLNRGDKKIMPDGSTWVWTGEMWEPQEVAGVGSTP